MKFMKTYIWRTPAGQSFIIYDELLRSGHLLIAGATGSGKSTVLSGLIHSALFNSPAKTEFVLIDPKRVDLIEYRDLPHTMYYASSHQEIKAALEYAIAVMESRYETMVKTRTKEFDGATLYVVIDELADLLTDSSNKRIFSPLIQRLAQLGRAAHVVVIVASQTCLASVLTTPIKCNFSSRLALRTATRQDSRNIIEIAGAETLPDPRTEGIAHGIWRNGANYELYNLPMYSEADRQEMIAFWTNQRPRVVHSFLGFKFQTA